jgi:hypothetical protein
MRLPVDLPRDEHLTSTGPLEPRPAAEIVDDVVRPLVRAG